MFKANLNIKFWDFALVYATILYNITPHSSIQNNIPNELFYCKRVNLSKIKVFGCIAYHNNLQDKASKLNENSDKGIFLGINTFSNSYIIINCRSHKVVSTREETFFEDKFTDLPEFSRDSDHTLFVNLPFDLNSPSEHNSMFGDAFPVYESRDEVNINSTKVSQNDVEKGLHNISIPFDIQSRVVYNLDWTRAQSSFHDSDMVLSITTSPPLTFRMAMNSADKDKWIQAIYDELDNLYSNNIMTFVQKVPEGSTVITTKWVFNIKLNDQNLIEKYKARLVARGFNQKEGIDYELTYSPTLNSDSIKLIIALAAKLKWNIHQLDIKAAYLNANLDKVIYTTIPPGDANYKKGFWRLNKALYGLKQSGRQWYETISSFLTQNGFDKLKSEPCIFKKYSKANLLCIIGLYVDDMLITGTIQEINDIVNKIKLKFKISKSGNINYILGIKIEFYNNSYYISQKNFIENLLNNYNIKNIKKCKTPCTGVNNKLNNDPNFDITVYKSAIGSLIYLAKSTRPDISFAVHYASRNCENPKLSDWKKVLNIFKYLNSTKNFKIKYDGLGDINAYCDADFAGDTKDRKSTSGCLILMGKSAISWHSKKQSVVATSTAEAEYISTSECTKKVLWIRNILEELFNYNHSVTIFTDNMASKKSIENGEVNTKLKHIAIKYHFNRDNIINRKIKLMYKNTEEMLADVLTKNVNGPKMKKFTDKIFSEN